MVEFIVKTNFPEADLWLQKRGSKHNVGMPKEKFDSVQGKYNIGIKLPDNINKEYFFKYLWDLFNRGYWKLNSYGTLNLQHIRIDDVKKALEQYRDDVEYKNETHEKVDRLYENWVKQTKLYAQLFMSTPKLRRKGQAINKLLEEL